MTQKEQDNLYGSIMRFKAHAVLNLDEKSLNSFKDDTLGQGHKIIYYIGMLEVV